PGAPNVERMEPWEDRAGIRRRCARGPFDSCSNSSLPIAPSTYYAHQARRRDPELRSLRAKHDEQLAVEIRRVWDESFDGTYGAEKVWRPRGYRCRSLHRRAADSPAGAARCRPRPSVQGDYDAGRFSHTTARSRRASVLRPPP